MMRRRRRTDGYRSETPGRKVAGAKEPSPRRTDGYRSETPGRKVAGAKEPSPTPDVEVDVDVLDEEETTERLDSPWHVILFNDAIHSFDEVILQLIKATGCSAQDAERIAWQAHIQGKSVAYQGTFEDCFRVQGVLREIQLVTEIEG